MTSGATDLELIDGSGVVTGLMMARPGAPAKPGDGTTLTIQEMIAAASADAPISKRHVPAIHVNQGNGVGLDYNAAEAVYSRTPGFYAPAGAATTVAIPAPTTLVGGPIVAICDFGGDVWFAQQGMPATTVGAIGGRVFRSVGGSAAPSTTTFAAYASATSITVGQYMRDLVVMDDAGGTGVTGGTMRLWASSSDINGLNGRLHYWDGATWQSVGAAVYSLTPDGANRFGRNRMCKVNWQTPDGSTGNRLVTISRTREISYTRPDSDPLLAASWIEDTSGAVKLGTGYALLELPHSRHHVWGTAQDGAFDLDGLGNSPNITSYLESEIQTGTGVAAIYHNNYLYMSSGRGIDRIYVGSNGQLQETPGQCAPGWGTPAENAYRGYATAFCTDQGYLVAAIYNPSTQTTGIFWGLDQQSEGSRNPLTWFGPEMFFISDYKVTRMQTSGAAGDLRLWVAAVSAAGTPILRYQSLPVAGSPLQDLLSAGSMKFATGGGSAFTNTYCRLSLLADTVGDEISTKILDQVGVGSRGLSINAAGVDDGNGTKLTVYSRADPDPGSVAWGTGVDATTSASQTILPAAETKGHRLENRVDFISPQGSAATPKIAVLTALRRDVWRLAPTLAVIRPIVEYGAGVPYLEGKKDDRDADTVTATIRSLANSQGRITLRDREDKRWTVKVEQVSDLSAQLHSDGFGKTVTAQLEITVVAGPL